jgi:membrane protease YdiL (CAAX protease family)
MSIIIPFLFVLGLAVVANLVTADHSKSTANLFELALAALNIPLLVLGVLLFMVPPGFSSFLVENDIPAIDLDAAGWVLIAVAIYSFIVCIRPARRLMARIIPLDPESAVHTLALVMAGYLAGNTFLTLTQDVLLELLATDVAVTVLDILLQQIAFVIVAFFGAGLLIRRNLREVSQRLGLERPNGNQILLGLGTIAVLIVLQGVIGAAWALFDPEQAQLLGELNDSLLSGFDSVGEWFILAIAAGIGEEILFRGALQPVFGLVFTSLLFAIVHIQYGLTPITLAVFLLGMILGILRKRTNTTVTVFVHFGYNFMLGLFALLAEYLQGFVG